MTWVNMQLGREFFHPNEPNQNSEDNLCLPLAQWISRRPNVGSNRKLAELVGCAESDVSRWTRGITVPQLRNAWVIIEKLGLKKLSQVAEFKTLVNNETEVK